MAVSYMPYHADSPCRTLMPQTRSGTHGTLVPTRYHMPPPPARSTTWRCRESASNSAFFVSVPLSLHVGMLQCIDGMDASRAFGPIAYAIPPTPWDTV